MNGYKQRIADIILQKKLDAIGAVLIEGAANLIKLESKIDTTRMKPPMFKMVPTAVGSYAYIRTDGIAVVPIGCLKD